MDMLAGYGSGSDDDEDVQDVCQKDSVAGAAGQQLPAQPIAQQQQQPRHDQEVQAQPVPKVQLPSAALLLDDTGAVSSNPAAAKRPFTAVTGHSLAKASSQPKATKEHASARPGGSAKPAGSMLVPPQLRGRSNVVTEDLDKIFSKKASPQPKKP